MYLPQCFLITLLNSFWIVSRGETLDGCPPADPNCHPSCIEYVAHCRYCRCTNAGNKIDSGSSSFSSGGMSTDHEWNAGFEEGTWSDKMDSSSGAWSRSDSSGYGGGGGGSGGSNKETIRYVVVEKEPSYSESIYPGGGMGSMHSMPNPFPEGGMGSMSHSPFSNPMMPASLGPGSNEVIDTNSMHGDVVHVPLVSPGQPKYCVRCRIISCPTSCERVDEYGCHSCPCAPSRFQTMPIMRDCSNPEPRHQPDCLATKLCVESCQEAYQLGEVGSDGCRSCKCIRRAAATTPSPEGASCPATLACMLKCTDGYVLGETDSRGCPACKCLSKGLQQPNSNKDNNSNKNNNNEWNNKWNTDTSNSNNNNNNNGGKKNCKGGSSEMLASTNGIGNGKCEPPLCLSGSMSVDQAMQMGKDSAGGGVGAGGGWGGDDCGEGNMDGGSFGGSSGSGYTDMGGSSGSGYIDMGKLSGMTGSGSSGMGGSGSSGGNPFMNSMSGAGAGGAGMGGGGGGMGAMGGGGGGMGAMGGGGGMPFSPFSSAMSGGGPGMPSGGPAGPMAGGSRAGGSAMGTASAVSATAYNKDCVGAECSAKNGMQHKDCPDLIHCLVTCDGSYKLGALGADGCQTCSCT